MSASMLRQMLEDAREFLKDQKYQQALDSSRRVTQFDPNNFQAFMCVGMASFHLQQWGDCEEAYHRAAGLKPDLPAVWKVLNYFDEEINLVGLYDERQEQKKKLDVLEKLVGIFQREKKVKPSQKWIAEVATTAMQLKMLPKAFDAWYALVAGFEGVFEEISLDITPNDELPSTLAIWFDIIDLLQRPNFSLSDCSGTYTMMGISDKFFFVVSKWNWTTEANAALVSKMDESIAFFTRYHLNQLKASDPKKKQTQLQHIDALALSIINWFPTAKIPSEFLLLRSEDQDSPITISRAREVAANLHLTHAKSPMALIFEGLEHARTKDNQQAQECIIDGLAYSAASSFHESALCIRAQMELASLALARRDVEECSNRLRKAKLVITEKAQVFGCSVPSSSVLFARSFLPSYSEIKVRFMEATAHEYSGSIEKALEYYREVMESDDEALVIEASLAAAELFLAKKQLHEALDTLTHLSDTGRCNDERKAVVDAARGWIVFQLGDIQQAKALLEMNSAHISLADQITKAKSLKRLAIVYWHLGDTYRTDTSFCFGHLLQAARLTPSDAEIFAWLGKWYLEVGKDVLRAEKCFLKALSLSPANEIAGVTLSDLYEQQGKRDLAVKLWENVVKEPETAPTWALLRLAQYLINKDDEDAIVKLHLVIRNDPVNAHNWVILAHLYRRFGKIVSAQKAYLKAIELGENGWCVRCELARIEGILLLFDEALMRLEPLLKSSSSKDYDDVVVSTIYASLLYNQAKSLCADGLYGHAASNLKKASECMKRLFSPPSEAHPSADDLKLLGDIHTLAYYLSPENFCATEVKTSLSWADFIAEGRIAYEKVLQLTSATELTRRAELFYDIGLNCWYEAHALSSSHNIPISAFYDASSDLTEVGIDMAVLDRVAALKEKAKKNFKLALQADPEYGLAWNGFAIVHDHLLVKQFAWTRAIQGSNIDAAWANLGMLYAIHGNMKSSASLAQAAFLHLDSVNPNNPSMWIGHGMLSMLQGSPEELGKALEAFNCALERGLDLDALQGLCTLLVLNESKITDDSAQLRHQESEKLLFTIRKYLERDPFNANAWNILGIAQHRLSLYEQARHSFERSLVLIDKVGGVRADEKKRGLEWNILVADCGVAVSQGTTMVDVLAEKIIAALVKWKNLASASKHIVISGIVKAQMLFYLARGSECLQELNNLLQSDIGNDERAVVAMVGLATVSLLMSEGKNEAAETTALCKSVLLDDQTDNCRCASPLLVEFHERYVGAESECISRLETYAKSSSDPFCLRLALAMIDFQTLKIVDFVTTNKRYSNCSQVRYAQVEDEAYLNALVSLLRLDNSGADGVFTAQKLIRMQPWNPHGYLLTSACLLKRNLVNNNPSQESDTRQAISLLELGLKIANASSSNANIQSQLLWLLSHSYATLGESEKVSAYSASALTMLQQSREEALPIQQLDLELLEARVLSTLNSIGAIQKYHSVLETVSGEPSLMHRLIPLLIELGGFYEELDMLDAALQVWKRVIAMTTPSSEEASVGAGAFLANLRLALIHGKKLNTKSARKQIKTTLSLVSAATSSASTVATFVESIITKSN